MALITLVMLSSLWSGSKERQSEAWNLVRPQSQTENVWCNKSWRTAVWIALAIWTRKLSCTERRSKSAKNCWGQYLEKYTVNKIHCERFVGKGTTILKMVKYEVEVDHLNQFACKDYFIFWNGFATEILAINTYKMSNFLLCSSLTKVLKCYENKTCPPRHLITRGGGKSDHKEVLLPSLYTILIYILY